MTVPAELESARIELEESGATVVLAGWSGRARGLFAVADTVWETSAAAVA